MAYSQIEDRRAASKRNYYANKAVYFKKSKVRKKKIYTEVILPFKKKRCVDCKKKFPPICMDFDHVRGKKLFSISSHYDKVPMKALLKEIKKCEITCANCHRIRTDKRRNSSL